MGSISKSTPVARGFATSLGYFHGAEDHYKQLVPGNVKCPGHLEFNDLWLNDGPVPTPGLLAYKHQYRGSTQALLSLRCGRASRAAAERVAQRQGESHSET